MQFNGSAFAIPGGTQLTTLGDIDVAGSAFFTDRKPYSAFTVEFDYIALNPVPDDAADGFTFTLQNNPAGANAIGNAGFNLGYQPINNSACIGIRLFPSQGFRTGENGVFLDFVPVVTINFINTPTHFRITYDSTILQTTISQIGQPDFVFDFNVDLSAILGPDNLAFIGFTGSTGIFTSTQTITNFIFISRVPCVHKDSLVSTITNNNKIIQRPISSLRANDVVIDYKNKPVILKNNIRFGSANSFVKIMKDSLGKDFPSKDLLIRKDHPILISGREIKAESLIKDFADKKKAKMVKVKHEPVYSLCTEDRTFVLIHGIPVCTWAYNDLITTQKDKYNFLLL